MTNCKLCKQNKPLLKKSHIVPEFLYKELYDEKHRIRKFIAQEILKKERISKPPKGEYESNLLCRECDSELIGQYESYVSNLLSSENVISNEDRKPKCTEIINDSGIEFKLIEQIDYKLTKLFLLSIIWRASISNRHTFRDVQLGSHEEKIREMIFSGNPLSDRDYGIVVLSWRNDDESAKDFICQPIKHTRNNKTFYTIVLIGYIIVYFIDENSIFEDFDYFRLKENGSLSIIHLPKGTAMNFMVNYTGANK